MKKIKYIYIIIIAIVSTLVSCEDYVDVDIPGQEKKIVAYCFLSPQDTVLRVFVFESNPLFDTTHFNSFFNPESTISNAIVTIDDGINSIQVPYDEIENKYYINAAAYPITAGTTYYLTVEIPGLNTVTSKTTIPQQTPEFTHTNLIQLANSNQNEFESYGRFLFETKWQDFAGEENFYSLNIFDEVISPAGEMTYYNTFQIHKEYLDDNGREGSVISTSTEIQTFTPDIIQEGTERYIRAYLLNCSKDYYLYHRSVMNGAGGSDPFSEPTIVYSNIENGLGCFGSFNGSSVAIAY